MSKKHISMLGFTSLMILVGGESLPGTPRNTSFLQALNKRISSVHTPRTQWTYRPQEDPHIHAFEGISHGSTHKAMESNYGRQNYSGLSQDYWWSNPAWQNFTNSNYYSYSKPSYEYLSTANGANGYFYKDSAEKFHSRYPYRQIRPVTSNQIAIKRNPSNNLKEKLQVLSFDTSGKPKFKKTHQTPFDYKKIVFSKIAKPYTKHKYQSQPYYKRYYYKSPYQRYAIPSGELLRYKDISHSGGYYKVSTATPNHNPGRHYTTERMDDVYPDGSSAFEGYSAYNDTNHSTGGNYYEETYEEVEKTTLDPDENSHEESSTRGYYGDRIYMSTQMPLVSFDKTGVKNKYFIVRRTSNDDDIETIFE